MSSASTTGPYSNGYTFLYSTNERSTEDSCNDIINADFRKADNSTMIWYNNVSLSFCSSPF